MKVNPEYFRTDTDRMFDLTDTLSCSKLVHTPFIVLDEVNGVTLCFSAKDLVEKYPPTTRVLKQWKGEYRSDFLSFDVCDVMLALKLKE